MAILLHYIQLNSAQIAHSTNSSFIFNTAYATSLPDDKYFNNSRITNIRFFTLNDYNQNYKSGAEMTEACFFGFKDFFNDPSYDLKTFILEYNKNIAQTNGQNFPTMPVSSFWIGLKEKPTEVGSYRFSIIVELDDGRSLQDEGPSIIIK